MEVVFCWVGELHRLHEGPEECCDLSDPLSCLFHLPIQDTGPWGFKAIQAGAAVLPCCALPRCPALSVHQQLCPSGPVMGWLNALDWQKNIRCLYWFSLVSPSSASWASSPRCQMNTSDGGEMCRQACLGTQGVAELWQRWLRLIETVGCSSTMYLFSAFLFPLCLDEFGRHSYILHLTDFSALQSHTYTMDLTLIPGLQKSLLTHRMLRGAYKKENLAKEQRHINNFNKIVHRHEKQNPNHQLVFSHQKCPQLVQLIWRGTKISK